MTCPNKLYSRKLPFLDKKWINVDLNNSLKNPDLVSIIFNSLIQDKELSQLKFQSIKNCCGNDSFVRSDGKYFCGAKVLDCSCCDGICSATSSCICVACQLIESDDINKKLASGSDEIDNGFSSSEVYFDSWMWGAVPDNDQKSACIKQLLAEQREICLQAAENCLSTNSLKQLLCIYERHFVALSRCKPENTHVEKQDFTVADCENTLKCGKEEKDPDKAGKATHGLARIGTRAALNFSFAFLRRAWKTGEDTEMCSELLQDSLEALQTLDVGSLFDTTNISSLWIEAVEKSSKFLRQVVLSDIGGERDAVPRADRNISLNLLLELGLQKGSLPGSLEGVLLLLTLSEKYSDNDDNRQPPTNASSSAPVVKILQRYQAINNYHSSVLSAPSVSSPSESFLRFFSLSESEDALIDMKQAAVVIISHLDRIRPETDFPAGNYSTKLQNTRFQQIFTFGYSSGLSSSLNGFSADSSKSSFTGYGKIPKNTIDLNKNIIVDQIVCSEGRVHILTTTGDVYMNDSQLDDTEVNLVEGFEKKNSIVKIASHYEGKHHMALSNDGILYSWGCGEGGRLGHGSDSSKDLPTIIQTMDEKQVIKICCGAQYSAAITDLGELWTWGSGMYGKLGHGNSDDKNIPTLVKALKGHKIIDVAAGTSHTLCVTDTGLVFSFGDGDFGKLGNGTTNGSQIPMQLENLMNISKVYCGSQFSVAVSKDGSLFTWGNGHSGRLGHGTNTSHLLIPKKVQALEGKRVAEVCVGSAHCLALITSGEVYGWGRNDYQQICPTSINKNTIITTPLAITLPFLKISGVACGAAQSIIWCQSSMFGVPQKMPFVIDLCEQSFRLLDQLLSMVCGSISNESRHPPSQEAEIVAVASLNLLRLQFHAIISNNVSTKQVGLTEGSRLLTNIKSRLLNLAGGQCVLKTMQEAAQWALNIGWSILFPKPIERGEILTSFLSVGESVSMSSGHRFMTDLLVGSLMLEGGLETALNQAINSESQDLSSANQLPLLHLLRQLLRNNSSLTQARLNQLIMGHLTKPNKDYFSSPETPSPSLDLLHKFQRLLLSYIYSSKQDDLAGAETLLESYLHTMVSLCIATLTKAHEAVLQNKDGVAEILQTDCSDSLLYELLIGLILIQKQKPTILLSFDWIKKLVPLLNALDNLNRMICDAEVQNSDNMGWPGIICRSSSAVKPLVVAEEAPLIRKSDVENNLLDGGAWIVINGNVYDIKNYVAENAATQDMLCSNLGKDLSNELAIPTHRAAYEHITGSLRIGKFETGCCDEKVNQECIRLTHFSSERTLAYLLGMRANLLQKSSPLQPAEISSSRMLNSMILRGGLQTTTNPFDEEKGEARSSGSTAASTPTDASNHQSLAEAPQMTNWPSLLIQQRVESLLSGLGEAKVNDSLDIKTWIAMSEKYCKENHLIWHQEFNANHPVIEVERLLTAVLIRHQNLGPLVLAVIDREMSVPTPPPQPIAELIKSVHVMKWNLIRMRQQLNRSYKEVCAPLLEKCRFLLYEVRPTISLEQLGLKKLFLQYKSPRFKSIVDQIIKDNRGFKQQLECTKLDDLLNVSIQSHSLASIKVQQIVNESLEKYLSNESLNKVGSNEAINTRSSSPAIDHSLEMNIKNNLSNENLLEFGGGDVASNVIMIEEKKLNEEMKTPINSTLIDSDFKLKQIEFSDQFVNDVIIKLSQKCTVDDPSIKTSINNQIMDFVLQEKENCDVETLRRAMYCQIQRYTTRKQGLIMFNELIGLNGLLDTVKYNLYNGYMNNICCDEDRDKDSNQVLDNLNLVTAYQKADVLLTHSKTVEWAIKEFQKYVNKYEHVVGRPKHHGEKDHHNIGTYVFLKKLSRARFLLSIFGILAKNFDGNELSLAVNSGLLGSILALLRQTGGNEIQGANVKLDKELSVVYEDVISKYKISKEGLTGPELAKQMKIGARVARGADWKWGEQDGLGEGRIISEVGDDGWVRVEWDTGATNSYRMGKEGQYDLRLADSSFKVITPDKESEKDDIIELNNINDGHPTKLLKNACIKMLQMVAIGVGVYGEKMQNDAVHGFASMFRTMLNKKSINIGFEMWSTIGFLRGISSAQCISNHLTTKLWINLYFDVLRSPIQSEKDIYKKVQCIRLLQTTLVNWHDSNVLRVDDVIKELFHILGNICLNCPSDLSLLHIPNDIKSKVLSSASHSGTIAEEIIVLLRKLHTLPIWNSSINEFLSQKLCIAADMFVDSDREFNVKNEKHYVIAALNVIGGCDPRPRLGLNLTYDGVRGTISRMTRSGKVVMCVHGTNESKSINISKIDNAIEHSVFSLSKLTINEMLLNSWAVLICGITNKEIPVSNHIDPVLLSYQQIQLSALKATRILYRHQNLLRNILKQRSPGITRYTSVESVCEKDNNNSDESNDSDKKNNTSDESLNQEQQQRRSPELLLQSILSRATQPSPLKACYSLKEMELAALNISQMLASHLNNNNDATLPMSRSRTILPPPQPTLIHGIPLYNESINEESSTENSNAIRPNKPTPLVSKIMDMGFNRKTIENAIKSMTNRMEVLPTAEQIVQWVVEHPESAINEMTKAAINDLNSLSFSGYHTDSESLSCSEYEATSEPLTKFAKRDDFKNSDQYAMYVRSHICPGMVVRCCRDFEEIRSGDIGTVLKVEPDGLHDLNVRVDWQMHERPFWMCFVHLEILEQPSAEIKTSNIAFGSQVRIKSTVNLPRTRLVKNTIGTVTALSGLEVTVDFPSQIAWNGQLIDLELAYPDVNAATASETYDIIDDWSRCIRSLTVSSNESTAKHLLERTPNNWQSCNNQGRPWIRLEIHEHILIHSLSIKIDGSDYSHQPSLVIVRAGDTLSTLKDFNWVSINPNDTNIVLLSNVKQYFSWIEILVKQCRNNGIQCRIHNLNIIGRRKQNDLDIMLMNASFLANENDTSNEPSCSTSNYPDDKFLTNNGSKEACTKALVWGLNDKEQLGGLKGSKVKIPTFSPVLSSLKPIHIAGGSKSLFIVSQDGKLYACGEGTNGRLGLGHNNNVPTPRQVPIINQYVVKKVAVHSGGKHCLSLTLDGRLFSWGEGEDGKLGHGNRLTLDKPKLIESLRNKRIRDIACGSSHSAAITSSGELYTWGLGEYGRLGHGDNNTQLKPKRVEKMLSHRVVQIACGSRDAQTLCLTEDGFVFSWGDGDFGKLGRGGSEGCAIPHQIERLNGAGIIQIECGAQFSLALSKSGEIWTWGKGDYYRLGHGSDQHVRKPTPIQGLRGKKIIHVAVGALHCLAVDDAGQVWAWGDNDHGQQGTGSTSVNKKPSLVLGLDSVFVNRVACGSSHSVAWSLPQNEAECDKNSEVPFSVAKDSLGGHSLGMYSADDQTTSSPQTDVISISKQQKKSLSEIALSLESFGARQAALTHILNAIRILQARSCIIAALTSHTQVKSNQNVENVSSENEEQSIIDIEMQEMSKFQRNINNNQVILETVANGGGEGPADVSGLIGSEIVPETDYSSLPSGSVYRSLTNSMSLSMSMSSCNATQKHSKMSASAMSVMACTMNHHEEMVNETFTTGLDDFTSLFGEAEARNLLELLKLSVSGRAGVQSNVETIASTLISLGLSSTVIGNMILETCISELEDTVMSRHCLGKLPKPIVQETSHPYIDDITLIGHVKIPGAEALRLEFDSQCSTEKRNDPLIIMDGSGRVIATRSGREYTQWAPEIRIPGDEMRWKFTSDNSVNGWGWKFMVHAIMPVTYLQELGSDRSILSQPSIALVMSLLDSNLGPQNSNILLRLVSALSQCAQISTLTINQRIWCLKKIHSYLTTSKCAPKPLDLSLTDIINPLISPILRQYEYEEGQVRTGVHLSHSLYFKTLIGLACDMNLDTILQAGDSHKWAWFKRYCSAVRVAQSLIRRETIPKYFCMEVRKKLLEITANGSVSSNQSSSLNAISSPSMSLSTSPSQITSQPVCEVDSLGSMYTVADYTGKMPHEDHDLFSPNYDSQLLQWFNRRPEDWAFSWGGASTIYGWGHNHRGQLGGLDGSRIKIPTPCEALSLLRPLQISGGEQTLYIVTADGKVYSTGYGAGGRLGIGGTDSVSTPTLIESLQHVMIKKVAVNSGGKHCLCLSADGECFSWGEGEDGKLGHGNRDSYDRPKLIETLSGVGVIDIACGSAHSACITSQGHVLTWGKGRYGRLGHGDSEDQLSPKIVELLLGYRAIDINCGSGDAQTLCITDDDSVWSWGDGDYGKLGRGGSDGCKVPMKIESLAGLGVVKVECGSQFSVALTRSGAVYTWGKGDYHRLGHGNTEHIRRPKKIAALQGKKIISIATGSLHCIACSDTGEVFTWGDNDEGQLGDGTVSAIQRPRTVNALQGKHIVKVICGSAHTLAFSTSPHSLAVRSPPSAPLEYDLVREISPEILQGRLVLLHHFSELICPCLAMLPIDGDLSLGALRDILVYGIKEASFRKVIQTTMVRDKPHGPIIELNRIQVKRSRNRTGNGFAGIDGMKSVFGQMVQKLPLLTQEALSMPHRVWKVKFVGESVDDCGGGFSESIAEMCDELQNGSVPLLIQTPNGRGEAGANRDCFLLDPTLNSVLHMNMFRFLGVLMGIAVRTGSPLSLNLAEIVWRALAGEQLRPSDLTEVDRDYVTGLLCIRDMDDDPKIFQSMELPFSTPSAKGHEVSLSTKYTRITPQNRQEYVKLALSYRLHEFDEQVKAVRDGMSKVIPVPLLSLFSAAELQAMVCGSPDIPLGLLKTVATYKGVESTSPLVQWFWEVMEEFSNQERSLFLRFVWGRTRLPRTIADFRGRDFVLQVLDKYNPADHFLPESYTCFFLLKMPRYSCKLVLLEKLKYAIHFCKSIDTDDYARVAIGNDPTEATESESELESIA